MRVSFVPMKNSFALFCLAFILITAFSCKDKNSKSAIAPDYSATGNPYPGNQTVTGTTTYTSPATQNTTFTVGDIGWSNPSCVSTQSMALRATKGNVDVILTFNTQLYDGTWAIASNTGNGFCTLQVLNAPGQPAGVLWVGKAGSVIISQSATSFNATLKNVICTQKDFNFPQVAVIGSLNCGQ